MKKEKKSLDWVGSADFAELNLRFDVALALGALDSAFDFGEDVFGFAELLAEMLVVKQLFFVCDYDIVFFEDGFCFLCEFRVGNHVVEEGSENCGSCSFLKWCFRSPNNVFGQNVFVGFAQNPFAVSLRHLHPSLS